MRYCPLASRNDCDVLEMDCDVVLKVLLLPLVVVLEMDCDVVLDVLLLPLDVDDDAAQHAAAEHS